MSYQIITLLNGMEQELKQGYKVIDATDENQIKALLSHKKIKYYSTTADAYGRGNKKYIDRITGDYSLKRGGITLIDTCEKIIALSKHSSISTNTKTLTQTGIIYCEQVFEENCFLSYEIKNFKNHDSKFTLIKTKYCIFNITNGDLYAIKDYKQLNGLSKKQDEITIFIKNYPNNFTFNQIRNELLQEGIIEPKNTELVCKVLDRLVKEEILKYTPNKDRDICYSKVKHNTKLLTK